MIANGMSDRSVSALPAGKCVLIAEDDLYIADELACTFKEEGAAVVGPFATLADAINAVATIDALDGAVLDINLFGERTYPLVDKLRERGIPCVFATGYGRSTIPILYQHIPHHQKPFESQAIVRALFG
ncbi:response regulator [Aureimonas sp. AU4]|uniref:response regulator n=1 Tax=Aureimonas sp. AU4 TaxID=1638163 RepID=UPI000B19296E|nr:response regulator [Aureimonas sp. AU4]